MLKAVIFDLDDTLVDTTSVVKQALTNVFIENLSHFPNKTVEEMLELNIKAFKQVYLHEDHSGPASAILVWFRIFELLNLHPSIETIVRLREQVIDKFTKGIRPKKGAGELLDFLRSKNIKVGVLTNGPFLEQGRKLIQAGIDKKIDYLVGSDMCMADKPDLKAFLFILNQLSVKPNEAIMVGDDFERDIKGGVRAGMKSICVKSEWNNYSKNEEKKMSSVVGSLDEIIPLIKRLIE